MNVIKAGRPLIEIVKLCYHAKLPLLVIGSHGIGKSGLFETAANELEIKHICRDLSLMEPTDLVGLPKLEDGVTRFFPSSFLPTGGEGLLVFEELNRCEKYMRAPCLQLLTSRTLNDYILPPGWLPVAAINPASEGYEVEELDQALLSRFVQVGVVSDRQEWLNWARSNGIDPGVLSYVEADEGVFGDPESNPRAWVYVSKVLQASRTHQHSPESLHVAIAG